MGDDDGGATAEDGGSGSASGREVRGTSSFAAQAAPTPAAQIEVAVATTFLDSQSFPEMSRYVWAYQVRIANHGTEPVRLRRRYWRITDARGHVTEVSGDGVVGEQPLIAPGEIYEYASAAPLETPSGLMGGHYEMEDPEGARFDVAVPVFSLDSPHEQRTLN